MCVIMVKLGVAQERSKPLKSHLRVRNYVTCLEALNSRTTIRMFHVSNAVMFIIITSLTT